MSESIKGFGCRCPDGIGARPVVSKLASSVFAALLLPALAAPVAAFAQDAATRSEPKQLPTIVVTGTRIPEPEFEVPASISVVTEDDIRQGPPGTDLVDTLARVPGLVAQNRESLAQDLQLSLRGFGARASFGVRGIRLLMDGLPYSLPDGQGQTDPFNLAVAQRIEVLRGPFSVLYGNAAGGVIQVFSQDGPPQPEVGTDLMFGSYGTHVERLQAGGTSGNVNYIANASWFGTDGYRQHSEAERNNFYTKWRYTPNDSAALTFIFNAENQPFAEDPSALKADVAASDPRTARSAVFTYGSGETHYHREGGVVYQQQLGANDQLYGTAWLGHRTVNQFLPFAGDDPLSGGAVVDLDNDSGGGSARWTHSAEAGGFPLKTIAGVDYQRLREHRKGFVNDDGRKGALARDEHDTMSRLGGYVQVNWKLGRWQLDGGVRHSRVKFDVEDHFVTDIDPDDSGSRAFSKTTGFASVLYGISPSVNVYASYGRGFETPAFAELAYRPDGTSGLNFNLDPSTSDNYEAGVKANFGVSGELRFALYRIDTDDEIVTAESANGRSTFQNAGSTRRSGAEFSLAGALGGGFHGYLAMTWLQADYASGPYDGNRLPGIPRTTFYGALDWSHAPSGFYAKADAQYRSRVFVDDVNSADADGYAVANLEAGFHQRAGGWKFGEFAQLNNLFDRQYIGAIVVNASYGRYYEPAPGRNWLVGLSANYSF